VLEQVNQRRAGQGPDEADVGELVQRYRKVVGGDVDRLGDDVGVEALSGQRCRLDDAPR
jgi:hypothetical protein